MSTNQIYEIATEQLEALRKLAVMSVDIYDIEGSQIIQAAELAIENRIYSMNAARKESIAKQNDSFRKWPAPNSGSWVSSQLVRSLPREDEIKLMGLVKSFDNFTKENDPYCEHDFGSVEFKGEKYFWKIDYFDESYEYGSEDPSNPLITRRVLTIMHSSEY